MAIEKFNRKEQKYFIDGITYQKLLNRINDKIIPDKYFKEKICNLYFDTENNDLIINSLKKPKYKEKVRLRSYNVPDDDDIVFLEIKKKYNKIVNKRRVCIPYKDAINYIENGIIPDTNKQIMKEIDYCFNRYNLIPKLGISYDRCAYNSKDDNGLRITFDNNIRSRKNIVRLDSLEDGDLLFEDGYVMEIKSLNGLPFWLLEVLDELGIYSRGFSKYGNIYKKMKECEVNV